MTPRPTLRIDQARGTAALDARATIDTLREGSNRLWFPQTAVRALLKVLKAANEKAGEGTPLLDNGEEAALLDMALEQQSATETCREEMESVLQGASLLLRQGHDQP